MGWSLFYGSEYDLSCYMFYGHLKTMYILLLLGGEFYMLFRSSLLIVLFSSSISLIIFCVLVLSITEGSVGIFSYNCGVVNFLFQFHQFLPPLLIDA